MNLNKSSLESEFQSIYPLGDVEPETVLTAATVLTGILAPEVLLVEEIAAGLLAIRRLLAARKLVLSADELYSSVNDQDELYVNSLRTNTSIPGEDIYLLIVARIVLDRLYRNKGDVLDAEQRDYIIIEALIESRSTRPSNEIRSVVYHFGFSLGQILQKADPSFYDATSAALKGQDLIASKESAFWTWLNQKSNHYDERLISFATALQFDTDIFSRMKSGQKHRMFREWFGYWDPKYKTQFAKKVPKINTFLGYVQRGAYSAMSHEPATIKLSAGKDAMHFLITPVFRSVAPVVRREPMPLIRTIVPQLVTIAQEEEMKRRGYTGSRTPAWIDPENIVLKKTTTKDAAGAPVDTYFYGSSKDAATPGYALDPTASEKTADKSGGMEAGKSEEALLKAGIGLLKVLFNSNPNKPSSPKIK